MVAKNLSVRFKAGRPGLKKVLGDLEEEIMEVVWGRPTDSGTRGDKPSHFTVRDVYETLRSKRQIAYTTVMTTMKILTDKGILKRGKIKRAYVYTPAFSKEEFQEIVVDQVVDGLMDGFAEPLLAHFVNIVKNEDLKVADSVEKLLAKKINGNNKKG